MAGNCSIFRSWNTGDLLTASDLTTSFTIVGVTNMTQSCIAGWAVDTNQFRATTDPFPAGVPSLPTSGSGEIERLRFMIKKLGGFTQWYSYTDPYNPPAINQLIVSGTGPHVIGSASTNSAFQLYLTGSFAGTRAFHTDTTLTPGVGNSGYGWVINPTLIEAASGTHAAMAGILVAPGITNGAATTTDAMGIDIAGFTAAAGTTNASGLKIDAAPTGATNNYALWVAGGTSRFEGAITLAGTSTANGPSFAFSSNLLRISGGTIGTIWVDQTQGNERMRLTDGGILLLGTTVTTGAAGGDFVLAGSLRGLNGAGNSTLRLAATATIGGSDVWALNPGSSGFITTIGAPGSVGTAAATDLVFTNNAAIRWSNASSSTALDVLRVNGSNNLLIGNESGVTLTNLSNGALKITYGGGAQVGTPTGGDKGAGTVNVASNYYINGTAITAVAPAGQLWGLTLSNNGTDAVNKIDVALGEAVSDDATATNRINMVLTAALTAKDLNAAWAVGSSAGMRDTGSIANGTWHIFLIERPDTGVVDVLASTSATAPTMPANYTKKRRIGAILRESATIIAFVQDGDYFRRKTIVRDVNTNNPGTAAVTATLSVPIGIRVWALGRVYVATNAATGVSIIVSDLDLTDEAPNGATGGLLGPITAPGSDGHYDANSASEKPTPPNSRFIERTNTSAQIRYRVEASSASVNVNIFTLGWYDARGKNS